MEYTKISQIWGSESEFGVKHFFYFIHYCWFPRTVETGKWWTQTATKRYNLVSGPLPTPVTMDGRNPRQMVRCIAWFRFAQCYTLQCWHSETSDEKRNFLDFISRCLLRFRLQCDGCLLEQRHLFVHAWLVGYDDRTGMKNGSGVFACYWFFVRTSRKCKFEKWFLTGTPMRPRFSFEKYLRINWVRFIMILPESHWQVECMKKLWFGIS